MGRSKGDTIKIDIPYDPHKYQKEVHSDLHRYRVLVAGRRFGKSVLARQEILYRSYFYKHDKELGIYKAPRFWIVSPTYRQAKKDHWLELKKEIPSGLIKRTHESELFVQLTNDVLIELKGSEKKDSLRGSGLQGVVMDEAAFTGPTVWDEIIQPMLLETKGWALFIGTPKGYNWFYKLYQRGQEGNKEFDKEWMSWRFSSYKNPYVPNKDIDKWQKLISTDKFSQEYLADFVTFEGRIYKNFRQKTHVIKPISIPREWKRYGGFDFSGGKEPASLVVIAVDPKDDTWYLIYEMYMKEKPSQMMISEMRAEIGGGQIGQLDMIWCDPHMTQLRKDYEAMEFYMSPARKEAQTQSGGWVRHGIDLIQNKLKLDPLTGRSKLYVFDTCEKMIEEFQQYEWKEAPDDSVSEPGKPVKMNDHGLDALRYFAVSYQKMSGFMDLPQFGKIKDEELGF